MRRRFAALALAALLLLPACARRGEEPAQGGYTAYYLAASAAGGDAICARPVAVGNGEALSTEALTDALLAALLRSDEADGFVSPLPAGTEVRGVRIFGGRAQVDFSAPYARLSGIDLSLADYCVTLTLTQLPGVYAVSITADGRVLPYRRTQILTAADTLLGSREDARRPITVQLYFWDEQAQELRPQQRTLALYEGQTRVNAVIAALLQGPEEDGALSTVLPEGFTVLSSRIDEGVCYLYLDADTLPAEDEARTRLLEALSLSLGSIGSVDRVELFVGGEPLAPPDRGEPAPGQA